MTELRIGVVTSRFNSEVTEQLERGALELLAEKGIRRENISVLRVPGAVEIPLVAMQLFRKKNVDGIVALGCVIRGETSHYDYVCESVERGLSQLQLQFERPIGFGVLTTENRQQALARAGGEKGNKGAEAAAVTLEMIELIKSID